MGSRPYLAPMDAEEYLRLCEDDEPDPFRRTYPYGQEGEPVGEIVLNPDLPTQHRIAPRRPIVDTVRVCKVCYRRKDSCICLAGTV